MIKKEVAAMLLPALEESIEALVSKTVQTLSLRAKVPDVELGLLRNFTAVAEPLPLLHEPRAQFRLPPLPPVGRPSRAGGKRRAKPSATSWRAHGRSKGRRPARRLPPLSQPLPATGSRT